jgi:DNA primase
MIRRAVAAHDRATVEGQAAGVSAALPLVAGLEDPVRQREYAHLLAELAAVSEASVLLALERSLAGRPTEPLKPSRRASVQERVEREMLRLLARDADIFHAFADRLTAEHFRVARHRKAFEALLEGGGDLGAIVAATEEEQLIGALSALAVEPLEGDLTHEYARGVWSRLHEFYLKRRSDELRAELQKLNPVTDDRYDGLFQRLVALDGELRRLRGADAGQVLTS